MSIYASHKDYRSEAGLKKDIDKGQKNGFSDKPTKVETPSGRALLKVKGMKLEQEILVKGIRELPDPEAENEQQSQHLVPAEIRNSNIVGNHSQIFPAESGKKKRSC